jgi:hypothetical protein
MYAPRHGGPEDALDKPMKTNLHKTARLGELVVAAFDEAAHDSHDPRQVSRLAIQAVMNMWRHAHRTSTPPSPRRI